MYVECKKCPYKKSFLIILAKNNKKTKPKKGNDQIKTSLNKVVASKDSKGNPKSYRINLTSDISIKDSNGNIKNKSFSNLGTIFYLSYPYLLGHSFFNVKDVPFLSVWLICTYYIIKISNKSSCI